MRKLVSVVSLVGALVLGVRVARAVDHLIPVRVYMNRAGSKTKVVAKGSFALPDPINDNPVAAGAQITFNEGAVSEMISLLGAGWTALGNPPGASGFKYSDPSGTTCRRVLVKATTIKALCRATAPGAPPFDAGSDAPIDVVLEVGGNSARYCAQCPNGGVQKGNPQSITKLTDCSAPAACPVFAPTNTPTAIPTATPTTAPGTGLCCDFVTGCSSAPSALECLDYTGGSTVGGGAVCDASGGCVAPPGTPGDCCEGTVPFQLCSMVVDQAACEGSGGTYFAGAICTPSGSCVVP